jgi:hypothetical protein
MIVPVAASSAYATLDADGEPRQLGDEPERAHTSTSSLRRRTSASRFSIVARSVVEGV